jgi:hypothetical protein
MFLVASLEPVALCRHPTLRLTVVVRITWLRKLLNCILKNTVWLLPDA